MQSCFRLSVLLLALAVDASHGQTVIYDSGNTYSIAPYVPARVDSNIVRAAPDTIPPRLPEATATPFQLPITTPAMQPGIVTLTPKALRYLQQPLFLVGSDPQSRAWLAARRERLIEIGAVGLLIQAEDLQDVEAMLDIASGLRLVPASAQGFADTLGLRHYPVLLSKDGWEQ